MMKRMLSLFLAVVLCFGILPVQAFAAVPKAKSSDVEAAVPAQGGDQEDSNTGDNDDEEQSTPPVGDPVVIEEIGEVPVDLNAGIAQINEDLDTASDDENIGDRSADQADTLELVSISTAKASYNVGEQIELTLTAEGTGTVQTVQWRFYKDGAEEPSIIYSNQSVAGASGFVVMSLNEIYPVLRCKLADAGEYSVRAYLVDTAGTETNMGCPFTVTASETVDPTQCNYIYTPTKAFMVKGTPTTFALYPSGPNDGSEIARVEHSFYYAEGRDNQAYPAERIMAEVTPEATMTSTNGSVTHTFQNMGKYLCVAKVFDSSGRELKVCINWIIANPGEMLEISNIQYTKAIVNRPMNITWDVKNNSNGDYYIALSIRMKNSDPAQTQPIQVVYQELPQGKSYTFTPAETGEYTFTLQGLAVDPDRDNKPPVTDLFTTNFTVEPTPAPEISDLLFSGAYNADYQIQYRVNYSVANPENVSYYKVTILDSQGAEVGTGTNATDVGADLGVLDYGTYTVYVYAMDADDGVMATASNTLNVDYAFLELGGISIYKKAEEPNLPPEMTNILLPGEEVYAATEYGVSDYFNPVHYEVIIKKDGVILDSLGTSGDGAFETYYFTPSAEGSYTITIHQYWGENGEFLSSATEEFMVDGRKRVTGVQYDYCVVGKPVTLRAILEGEGEVKAIRFKIYKQDVHGNTFQILDTGKTSKSETCTFTPSDNMTYCYEITVYRADGSESGMISSELYPVIIGNMLNVYSVTLDASQYTPGTTATVTLNMNGEGTIKAFESHFTDPYGYDVDLFAYDGSNPFTFTVPEQEGPYSGEVIIQTSQDNYFRHYISFYVTSELTVERLVCPDRVKEGESVTISPNIINGGPESFEKIEYQVFRQNMDGEIPVDAETDPSTWSCTFTADEPGEYVIKAKVFHKGQDYEAQELSVNITAEYNHTTSVTLNKRNFSIGENIEVTVNTDLPSDVFNAGYRLTKMVNGMGVSQDYVRNSEKKCRFSVDEPGQYLVSVEVFAGYNNAMPVATYHVDFAVLSNITGWLQENGTWYYYRNGISATGWLMLNRTWYYFHPDGAMATGWVNDSNKQYYFNADGSMVTGWNNLNGKWYHFKSGGAMTTGWLKDSNKWYYLQSDGAMATDWQEIGTKKYYFKSDGTMATGWLKTGGSWYYLNADGIMAADWQTIGGKKYYFQSDGTMTTGWQEIEGKKYYFKTDGAMATGWQEIEGKKYYFKSDGTTAAGWQMVSSKWYYLQSDGTVVTGWQVISGKKYYFKTDGVMATGWQRTEGNWYYLSSGGAMVTGLQVISGKKYCFESDGVMATGWLEIDGKKCYFKTDGAMATGWQTIDGKKLYFKTDGTIATGWQKVGTKWYYLQSDGTMATNWQKIGTKWYYLKADGTMATGWLRSGSQWYYLNSDGCMVSGWLQLGKQWYYFNSSGAMATGWQTIGSTRYYFNSSGVWTK